MSRECAALFRFQNAGEPILARPETPRFILLPRRRFSLVSAVCAARQWQATLLAGRRRSISSHHDSTLSCCWAVLSLRLTCVCAQSAGEVGHGSRLSYRS